MIVLLKVSKAIFLSWFISRPVQLSIPSEESRIPSLQNLRGQLELLCVRDSVVVSPLCEIVYMGMTASPIYRLSQE